MTTWSDLRGFLVRRTRRNLLANGGASLAVAVLQLVMLAALARLMSASQLAEFVVAVALIALCESLSDFGSRHWSIRQMAFVPERFRDAVQLKAVFSSMVLIAAAGVSPWMGSQLASLMLAVCIGITQSAGDPQLWWLRARQRMGREAAFIVGNRLAISAGIVIGAACGWQVTSLLLIWLACNLIRVVMAGLYLNPRPLRLANRSESSRFWYRQLPAILWLGLAAVCYTLYYRAGLLWLNTAADAQTVAAFGLMFSLASTASIAANTLSNVAFPKLSILAQETDATGYVRQLKGLLTVFMVLFLSVGLLGTHVADPIAALLFGHRLSGSGYLRQLVPWIYLTSLAVLLRCALLAASKDGEELAATLGSILAFGGIVAHGAGGQGADVPSDVGDLLIQAYLFGELVGCLARAICLARSRWSSSVLWLAISGVIPLYVMT